MKIYLAGPLFTAAERDFNARLAESLHDAGHEVFLPQEKEDEARALAGENVATAIFKSDVAGIDWADVVVACMDGADPDSGTCWECGYAYGKKPVVVYRTDLRSDSFPGAKYNLMLTESADAVVDLSATAGGNVVAAFDAVVDAIRTALESL